MQNENEKRTEIARAKGLAKFFEIRLTIKIFGQTIIDYKWPPQAGSSDVLQN